MGTITLKPGQLCTIDKKVYRAKKASEKELSHCCGCSLNSVFKCPAVNLRKKGNKIDCWTHNIILQRVQTEKPKVFFMEFSHRW